MAQHGRTSRTAQDSGEDARSLGFCWAGAQICADRAIPTVSVERSTHLGAGTTRQEWTARSRCVDRSRTELSTSATNEGRPEPPPGPISTCNHHSYLSAIIQLLSALLRSSSLCGGSQPSKPDRLDQTLGALARFANSSRTHRNQSSQSRPPPPHHDSPAGRTNVAQAISSDRHLWPDHLQAAAERKLARNHALPRRRRHHPHRAQIRPHQGPSRRHPP